MANFFGRFQERFNEAMQGRNGMDTLSRYSFYLGFILVIIDLFVGSLLLSTPALVLLIYSIFRSYSRNIPARERENASFENFLAKIHFPFAGSRNRTGGTGGNFSQGYQASARGASANAGSNGGNANGANSGNANGANSMNGANGASSSANSSANSSADSSADSSGASGAAQIADEVNTVYFTCSNCGQRLSVPRGKGTLRVTCPKCHLVTTVKS